MLNRLPKPTTFAVALLLTVTLTVLSRASETNSAEQLGVPFGVEQLQAQLATLQARIDALQPRKFYVTVDLFDGAQAPAACAPGYHMASLWEILDPTGLRYDTTRGYTQADAGSGPPVSEGWLRTGMPPRATSAGAGENNCNAYTSSSADHLGSVARFEEDWEFDGPVVSPWLGRGASCSTPSRVWCVQD
jgi:hypothetical protein